MNKTRDILICMKHVFAGMLMLMVCLMEPVISSAQLNRGGTPWSFNLKSGQPLSVDLILTPPDLDAVAEEDLLHPVPYRFAVNLQVDVGISEQLAASSEQLMGTNVIARSRSCDPEYSGEAGATRQRHPASHITYPESRIPNCGSLKKLPSGDRLWLCTIQAPGAKAITLYFDRFKIPAGGRLFIYNRDKSRVLGAFTELNNNTAELFSTALIPGDQITLEYNQPVQTSGFPVLHISEIAYAYRGVPEAVDRIGFGTSGPCEVNVHCPEGNLWLDQQKGIARIGVKKNGGTYWCSGSLLNNTRQDKSPYFLTADHCVTGATPQDINQWIFYFGFQSPTCEDPPFAPVFRSLTGAVVKAASGNVFVGGSDFLLLLLNQTVPDTFDVWFNGWNRADVSSPNGVGIHHPDGDIKKISTYITPLVPSSWIGGPVMTHWEMVWAETVSGHGVTEGGSSGSPLFDPARRIVGALTGGDASCDSSFLDQPDYYGKFSYSWDLNGADSSRRLDYWIDPDNTGVMVLDGISLNIPEAEIGPTELKIYPNPASDILHLKSIIFLNQDLVYITLLDSWGRPVMTVVKQGNGTNQITLDTSTLPGGFYLLRISLDEQVITGRIIKL